MRIGILAKLKCVYLRQAGRQAGSAIGQWQTHRGGEPPRSTGERGSFIAAAGWSRETRSGVDELEQEESIAILFCHFARFTSATVDTDHCRSNTLDLFPSSLPPSLLSCKPHPITHEA